MSTNPFNSGVYHGMQTSHVSSEDRIRAVQGFDEAQCEAALQVEGLQKTVTAAIERRLRLIDKPQVAWCYATGLIAIGDAIPADEPDGSGPIEVARGPKRALTYALSVVARHGQGKSEGSLLVPGVPEAESQEEKATALGAWLTWCGQRKQRDSVKFAKGFL